MNVLWIAGLPGVGKSTVAWELYHMLLQRRERVAYVDIDQLGILFPESTGDEGRFLLKHAALARYVETLKGRIDRLVVSGVTADHQPKALAGASLRIIRLVASAQTHRERLSARGLSGEEVQEMLTARLHMPDALAVDNSDTSASDVAARLLGEWERHPGVVGAKSATKLARNTGGEPKSGGEIVWLTGPRCVGTSTVGWSMAMHEWQDRRSTGFLDLGQMSFVVDDEMGGAVKRTASVWREFCFAGAERLVIVGEFPKDANLASLRSAFQADRLTVVWLDATPETLRQRVDKRRSSGPALLAGDDLIGASPETAAKIAENAIAISKQPLPHDAIRLTTDASTPEDLAAHIRNIAEW